MKNPKNLLFVIFLLVCLGFTCYQTYLQFREYVGNEDNASIEYRNFNLEEKDQYPTFTICFMFLQRGDHFDGSHLSFQANNITPSLYNSFLIGEENDDPKYDKIVYDDVVSNTDCVDPASSIFFQNLKFLSGNFGKSKRNDILRMIREFL